MKSWHRLMMISGMCLALAACNDTLSSVKNKVEHPLPTKIVNRMKAYDMTVNSPIMMRIFKEESVLEVWKAKANGRYEKIAEYDICKWSGALGPKRQEGDRQAPEGFYTVNKHQMNPNSSYYLSFNLGYPNKFDRAHGRTGSNLMVHGACSSAGCYSMTDENVLEIYAFAREAFRGGQQAFQVQAFPFRMTAENMAEHRNDPNYEFWKMLKVGYDHFELTRTPPKVEVCEGKYIFNRVAEDEDAVFDARAQCPSTTLPRALEVAYASYVQEYEKAFIAELRKESRRDGGGAFAALMGGASEPTPPAAAKMDRPTPSLQAAAMPAQNNSVATAAAEPVTGPVTMMQSEAAEPLLDGAAVPVPMANPQQNASLYAAPQPAPAAQAAMPAVQPAVPERSDKPFWKLWN